MSRDELVQRYLEGQMSRRVFIRRLVTSGVSLAAALSYSELLRGIPAEAAGGSDFYIFVFDYGFSPNPATPVRRGQTVEWGFSTSNWHNHSASDSTGMGYFDSGFQLPAKAFFHTFVAAGTYPYRCLEITHTPMTGTIKVPMKAQPPSGALGTMFTITWASQSAPAGYVYDVQIKRPGDTAWSAWRTGATAASWTITPGQSGDFLFRARLRKPVAGKASRWSSQKKITVTP